MKSILALIVSASILLPALQAEAAPRRQPVCVSDKRVSVCHTIVNGRVQSSTIVRNNRRPVRIVKSR